MSEGVTREDMSGVGSQMALQAGQIMLQRDLIAGLLGLLVSASPRET